MIVQKLDTNKDAVGVFGFSFLEENPAKLVGVALDGVEPTYENISAGKYKGARKMFVYVKKDHVGMIPGLEKFIAEFTSEKAAGEDGYLAQKGLVPLPKADLEQVRTNTSKLETLTMEAFTN